MTYDDLNNEEYISNENCVCFSDNENDLLFELSFEMAKCKSIDNVNMFLKNVSDSKMFYFKKLERTRQPIGLVVSSYFSSLNNLKTSEDLKNILTQAFLAGFKAHDAKNLYMKIRLKSNDIDQKNKRKIDIFINSHPTYFKSISRRIKSNKLNYNVDKDYCDFGTSENNLSPVSFGTNEVFFKMFRSTLNYNTIVASLELCNAIFQFCKNEIYVDDLLEYNSNVETKFEDYIQSTTTYFKSYEDTLKVKMEKEENILRQENLNNNLSNCSDIVVEDSNENGNENTNYHEHWHFGKTSNVTEYMSMIDYLKQIHVVSTASINDIINELFENSTVDSSLPF